MTTIVTRAGKGSSLSWAEADANFTNLNTDKFEASDIGVSIQAYSSNLDEYAAVNPTAAGLALLDDATAAAQRTTLGLGNVDNTSDATKNSATATLTNKTLTSPKITAGQFGNSGTATNNFTITAEAADGTMKLARGNAGATTQDIVTVDASGKVAFPQGKSAWNSGEIIQQLFFTDAGDALPAIMANVTQITKNITPKSTDSTIKVSVSFYGYPISTGSFISFKIRQILGTASDTSATISFGLATAGVAQGVNGNIIEGLYNNTSTSQLGFQLWANNATGAGGDISSMVWTITEVQN